MCDTSDQRPEPKPKLKFHFIFKVLINIHEYAI